jgi:hypothetical protein
LEKFAMKKTLIALAALAAASTAFAQSTATISGTMNVGIMDTGAAGAKAAVASLGGGANAINIVTAEDLGGGLRGGFDSQIRFNSSSGDMGSNNSGGTALFHAANVYIGGGFGTVRMGKIAEASNCGFDPWGCAGGAALSAGSAGISALVGAGSVQSAVSYSTPTISGFSASYSTSVSARTNERELFAVNYSNGPLTAQLLNRQGGANTTTATGTAALDDNSKSQALSVGYNFGVARLTVANIVNKAATTGATSADITSVGVTVPMGAYTLLAGINKDSKKAAAEDTKTAVGVNYALSKRTTLGADLFKAEKAGDGTGFVIRARHTF